MNCPQCDNNTLQQINDRDAQCTFCGYTVCQECSDSNIREIPTEEDYDRK